MNCQMQNTKQLRDGRIRWFCPVCKAVRWSPKPVKRECQPDIEIKKKPCKGCDEEKGA